MNLIIHTDIIINVIWKNVIFEWLIKKNQLFMNQTTWMAIINMAQIVRTYANPVFDLLKRIVSQQSFVHNLDYTDPTFLFKLFVII